MTLPDDERAQLNSLIDEQRQEIARLRRIVARVAALGIEAAAQEAEPRLPQVSTSGMPESRKRA